MVVSMANEKMKTHSVAEQLLQYKVLPFPEVEFPDFDEWTNGLIRSIGNEPVELLGAAPLTVVFRVFLKLRDRATEITYRAEKDARAFVVFSLYDSERYIRTWDVIYPARWDDAELDAFEREQAKDTSERAEIPLDEWWTEASGTEDPLRDFLSRLYAISPAKKEISFHGSAPVLPALLALNWFAGASARITYDGKTL